MKNPQYYLVDDNAYLQDNSCCTCCDDDASKYPFIPNKNTFFEHDVLVNYSPVVVLADIKKEVAILEATLPEYRFLYDGAANRHYKVVVRAHVDTKIKLPKHTVMNGTPLTEYFCKAGQFLVLGFTVSFNKFKMVLLEVDLNAEVIVPNVIAIKNDVEAIKIDIQNKVDTAYDLAQAAKEHVKDAFNNIRSEVVKVQDDLDARVEASKEIAKEAVVKVTTAFSDVNKRIDDVDAEISKRVSQAKVIAQAAKDKAETIDNRINVVEADITIKVAQAKKIAENAVEVAKETVAGLNDRIDDVSDDLSNAIKGAKDKAAEALTKATEIVNTVNGKIKAIEDDIDNKVGKAFSFAKKVKEEAEKHLDEAAENLAEVKSLIASNKTSIEDLEAKVDKRVAQAIAIAQKAEEAIKDEAAKINADIAANKTAIEDIKADIADKVAKAISIANQAREIAEKAYQDITDAIKLKADKTYVDAAIQKALDIFAAAKAELAKLVAKGTEEIQNIKADINAKFKQGAVELQKVKDDISDKYAKGAAELQKVKNDINDKVEKAVTIAQAAKNEATKVVGELKDDINDRVAYDDIKVGGSGHLQPAVVVAVMQPAVSGDTITIDQWTALLDSKTPRKDSVYIKAGNGIEFDQPASDTSVIAIDKAVTDAIETNTKDIAEIKADMLELHPADFVVNGIVDSNNLYRKIGDPGRLDGTVSYARLITVPASFDHDYQLLVAGNPNTVKLTFDGKMGTITSPNGTWDKATKTLTLNGISTTMCNENITVTRVEDGEETVIRVIQTAAVIVRHDMTTADEIVFDGIELSGLANAHVIHADLEKKMSFSIEPGTDRVFSIESKESITIDSSGEVEFLTPGVYKFKVSFEAYEPFELAGVELNGMYRDIDEATVNGAEIANARIITYGPQDYQLMFVGDSDEPILYFEGKHGIISAPGATWNEDEATLKFGSGVTGIVQVQLDGADLCKINFIQCAQSQWEVYGYGVTDTATLAGFNLNIYKALFHELGEENVVDFSSTDPERIIKLDGDVEIVGGKLIMTESKIYNFTLLFRDVEPLKLSGIKYNNGTTEFIREIGDAVVGPDGLSPVRIIDVRDDMHADGHEYQVLAAINDTTNIGFTFDGTDGDITYGSYEDVVDHNQNLEIFRDGSLLTKVRIIRCNLIKVVVVGEGSAMVDGKHEVKESSARYFFEDISVRGINIVAVGNYSITYSVDTPWPVDTGIYTVTVTFIAP